jgi:dihydroorotate dehydrogenase
MIASVDTITFLPDFRDLIEAADTIQKMKVSSLSVINSLADMQSSSHNLHQKTMGYTLPYATTGTTT